MIVQSSFGFPSNIFKPYVMGLAWFLKRALSENLKLVKCTILNVRVRKITMLV